MSTTTHLAPRRLVVVGNGIAGRTAAESLREAGFDGGLTIVGSERHAPYSRPALSKAALTGSGDMGEHTLPVATHTGTELCGVSATGLDPERKLVRLASGDELPFDGLVIASGSRARRLPGGEADSRHHLTLRGLDDAVALRGLIAARPRVAVLGGGPLGMEIASGCLAAGCEVTLATDRPPMVGALGGYLSDLIVTVAREHGLRFAPGRAVSVDVRDDGAMVALAGGSTLDADLVVSAIGDRPNLEWLDGSGLLTEGRLDVDTRGRVRPDIVAAGDVATMTTVDGPRRFPFWTSAIDQARSAASALLRGDAAPELALQPYFWTEQFGLNVKASGPLPADGNPAIVTGDPADRSALLRFGPGDGPGTAVAINHRIPVPKLRRLAASTAAPAPARAAA